MHCTLIINKQNLHRLCILMFVKEPSSYLRLFTVRQMRSETTKILLFRKTACMKFIHFNSMSFHIESIVKFNDQMAMQLEIKPAKRCKIAELFTALYRSHFQTMNISKLMYHLKKPFWNYSQHNFRKLLRWCVLLFQRLKNYIVYKRPEIWRSLHNSSSPHQIVVNCYGVCYECIQWVSTSAHVESKTCFQESKEGCCGVSFSFFKALHCYVGI